LAGHGTQLLIVQFHPLVCGGCDEVSRLGLYRVGRQLTGPALEATVEHGDRRGPVIAQEPPEPGRREPTQVVIDHHSGSAPDAGALHGELELRRVRERMSSGTRLV